MRCRRPTASGADVYALAVLPDGRVLAWHTDPGRAYELSPQMAKRVKFFYKNRPVGKDLVFEDAPTPEPTDGEATDGPDPGPDPA